MSKGFIFVLKLISKLYDRIISSKQISKPECEQNPNIAAKLIYETLISNKPSLIARFGANELSCAVNYIGVISKQKSKLQYIKGDCPPWWWEEGIIQSMYLNAGFFPPEIKLLEKFSNLMIKDISQIDILGSWLSKENYFKNELQKARKVRILFLDPYWSDISWTKALEGKKVLVIHPFQYTIEQQYLKRTFLFKNNLLPKFELKTIKAVQSIAGTNTKFADWFEALDHMKEEMNRIDYDICLIGAGAYGFPLAAHAKRMGKKGFHLGGSLQLLFGIRGKRWENPQYGNGAGLNYQNLFNKYWIKPSKDETPTNSNVVEDNCYW